MFRQFLVEICEKLKGKIDDFRAIKSDASKGFERVNIERTDDALYSIDLTMPGQSMNSKCNMVGHFFPTLLKTIT